MKYAAQIGSCGKIYVPNFIKIGSRIQKLLVGIETEIHGQ